MTVKQGLSSLVNSSPNFSNQGLENAINEIKNVDKDDGYLWIKSTFDMDTAIHDNTVLTTSQKNDALETLYNAQPHLQIGRYLKDVIRHTNTILDGTIVTVDASINEVTATFLEMLNLVQSLQSTIPDFYGVTAKEKSRGVNDHFGILRGIFFDTSLEDSSNTVFTRLKQTLELIDTNSRRISALATATAAVRYSNTQLIDFLATVVADSTDFQTTLDNRVNTAAGNMANLQTRIAALPGDPTVDLIAIREEINTQVNLETSNLSGIRTYTSNLTNNMSYTSLAEDSELADLMAKTSQTSTWIDYFENYKTRKNKLNPLYGNISTDSDKESIIDEVLKSQGLPDVVDYVDLVAVANKAKKDLRIDTAGFNSKTTEKVITESCDQLGITTANRSIFNQSKVLLNNMNKNDRLIIANALDDNETSDTIS